MLWYLLTCEKTCSVYQSKKNPENAQVFGGNYILSLEGDHCLDPQVDTSKYKHQQGWYHMHLKPISDLYHITKQQKKISTFKAIDNMLRASIYIFDNICEWEYITRFEIYVNNCTTLLETNYKCNLCIWDSSSSTDTSSIEPRLFYALVKNVGDILTLHLYEPWDN